MEVKIEHDDMKKAIQSGYSNIQVGTRKFLLLEVQEVNKDDCYEASDIEEERLLAALDDNNPILSEEEVNKMVGN